MIFVAVFVFVGARLPLYACKKLEKSGTVEKLVISHEAKEPPVVFLESLVLGEVNYILNTVHRILDSLLPKKSF